jgi:hypothetical protein
MGPVRDLVAAVPPRVRRRLPATTGWGAGTGRASAAPDHRLAGPRRRTRASGIALGPIFTSAAHGYDTLDHFHHIDPRLGDDHDFHLLVPEAHRGGLRVQLDGAFNHVSFARRSRGVRAIPALLARYAARCEALWRQDADWRPPPRITGRKLARSATPRPAM